MIGYQKIQGGYVSSYFTAAKQVLNCSGLSEFTLQRVAEAVESQQPGAVSELLNNQDFNWPWFDECRQRFQNSSVWPDLPAWSWFEEEPDLLKGKKDVLSKLPTKILRNIATRHQITIPKGSKVADIRVLLARKLTEEQILPYRTILNQRIIDKDEAERLQAKFSLLESSIRSLAYNSQRHEQLAMMVIDMGFNVTLSDIDPAAELFSKNYQFNVRNSKNVPPFYPGDTTSLSSVR
tara:strand:+ start:347 stop:1054 length:708 start_codon:yes stop_codon:yes gene_type:complete